MPYGWLVLLVLLSRHDFTFGLPVCMVYYLIVGRAWLYLALSDHLLESYILCFMKNSDLVRKHYVKEALVLDEQVGNTRFEYWKEKSKSTWNQSPPEPCCYSLLIVCFIIRGIQVWITNFICLVWSHSNKQCYNLCGFKNSMVERFHYMTEILQTEFQAEFQEDCIFHPLWNQDLL